MAKRGRELKSRNGSLCKPFLDFVFHFFSFNAETLPRNFDNCFSVRFFSAFADGRESFGREGSRFLSVNH